MRVTSGQDHEPALGSGDGGIEPAAAVESLRPSPSSQTMTFSHCDPCALWPVIAQPKVASVECACPSSRGHGGGDRRRYGPRNAPCRSEPARLAVGIQAARRAGLLVITTAEK